MAIAFNVLKIFFPESSIWFFWVIPAFLGTLQLFYFGTYLPHRKPHDHSMEPHKARTQKSESCLGNVILLFFWISF